MLQVYSNYSNCVRAAKSKLGKTAKPNEDFSVTKHPAASEDKKPTYSFTALAVSAPAAKPAKTAAVAKTAKAAKPKKVRASKTGSIINQPKSLQTLKLMRRKQGVTNAQGAEALGVEVHTFRASVCRLRKELPAIEPRRIPGTKGTVAYFLEGSE